MNKTISIIGGNGFIGRNLVNYFFTKGYEVLLLDHNLKNYDDYDSVKKAAVDIHHTKELLQFLKNSEYVVWLVHASVPSTKDDSLVDDFMLNIAPIIKFLEKAEQLPLLKKFIYLSSGGTIYGDPENKIPIKENTSQNPISNYGLSKSIAEKYISYLTQNKNFDSYILRPSNVYGPYQNLIKPQGIIGFALKSLKNNSTLNLYDGGKVIRDFIFVDDVSTAIESIIGLPEYKGKVKKYNLGSNQGYSIREVLDKIEHIAGKKLNLIHQSSRDYDCSYNVLDSSELCRDTQWKCRTTLEEGLTAVWEWIKKENV